MKYDISGNKWRLRIQNVFFNCFNSFGLFLSWPERLVAWVYFERGGHLTRRLNLGPRGIRGLDGFRNVPDIDVVEFHRRRASLELIKRVLAVDRDGKVKESPDALWLC